MADIHDINEARPHLSGWASCVHCNHEWVAVVPVGETTLQCPNCELFHGVMQAAPEPAERWRCNCGCEAFWMTPGGAMCRYCGSLQEGF